MRFISKSAVLAGLITGMVLVAADAQAIPAFARKYKVGCNTCHTIYPQLNRFGRDFRDNGFRTAEEVQALLKKMPVTPPAAQAPATATPSAEEVDTLQTVQVTGIRRSIMSSVNTKNSSDSIVEVVSSEDLGKLPDVSIAESLARLPGLAAQRVDGRA